MARDVTQLHPRLQVLAQTLVSEAAKEGLVVKITSCVRDAAEQAECVRKGTSKCNYPWSHHNWGTAFDICRNDGKGAYNDSDGWFTRVGRIGQRIGLEWGGGWKSPVDKPHFQLPDWGTGCQVLIATYGNPDNFRKTWGGVTPAPEPGKVDEDGLWGPATTSRLQQIFGTPVDGVVSHQYSGWKSKNPGLTAGWEWEKKPASGGSPLIRAIQNKVGVEQDGWIGPDTIAAIQRWMGTEADGNFSNPSPCIRALQKWCNQQ